MLDTTVNHFTKLLSHKFDWYVQICSFMLFLFIDGMLNLSMNMYREQNHKNIPLAYMTL